MDLSVIRSSLVYLGKDQEISINISHIIAHYKENGYKVTEYVKSHSYEFVKDPFFGRKNRKEFILRLTTKDDGCYCFVEKPSYLFFFPILLVVGISIYFIVMWVKQTVASGADSIWLPLLMVAIVGVQFLGTLAQVTSAYNEIRSILREKDEQSYRL